MEWAQATEVHSHFLERDEFRHYVHYVGSVLNTVYGSSVYQLLLCYVNPLDEAEVVG